LLVSGAAFAQLGGLALGKQTPPEGKAPGPTESEGRLGAPATPTTKDKPVSSGYTALIPPGSPGAGLRDPFWPIGWVPPPPQEEGGEDTGPKSPIQWGEAAKRLQVTALSKKAGGGYIAILKEIGVVEKGDVITLTHGGLIYQWEIKNISSKGVVPKRLDVTTPKRR